MNSKAFVFLGLLFAFLLLVNSAVAEETTSKEMKKVEQSRGVDDAKYYRGVGSEDRRLRYNSGNNLKSGPGGYQGGNSLESGCGGYQGGKSFESGRGGYQGGKSLENGRGGYNRGHSWENGHGGYNGGNSLENGRGGYNRGHGGGVYGGGN